MTPKRFEVWLAKLNFNKSQDRRPCVVVTLASGGSIRAVAISGNMNLYTRGQDFVFDPNHPDFAATGLKKKCFGWGEYIVTAEQPDFVKRWGVLQGELAKEFEEWLGE